MTDLNHSFASFSCHRTVVWICCQLDSDALQAKRRFHNVDLLRAGQYTPTNGDICGFRLRLWLWLKFSRGLKSCAVHR